MQIISLILSTLAFLVGDIVLILALKDRKRNRVSNKVLRKAMVDYIDRKSDAVKAEIFAEVKKVETAMGAKIDKTANIAKAANTRIDVIKRVSKDNSARIEQLEEGCVPDFNEAMRAVNAVNEMNSGIANIFGYDPLEALQKSRQEGE